MIRLLHKRMTGCGERALRVFQPVVPHQHVVGVVGRDAEDRDARRGQRARQRRHDAGQAKSSVPTTAIARKPRSLPCGRRDRVVAANDRELARRADDRQQIAPRDPSRDGARRPAAAPARADRRERAAPSERSQNQTSTTLAIRARPSRKSSIGATQLKRSQPSSDRRRRCEPGIVTTSCSSTRRTRRRASRRRAEASRRRRTRRPVRRTSSPDVAQRGEHRRALRRGTMRLVRRARRVR